MDRADDQRAVPHGRRHALGGASADVADREHAGARALEHERAAVRPRSSAGRSPGGGCASSPVTTKPLSSWPTKSTSPSDLGEAPIIANTAEVSTRRSGPAARDHHGLELLVALERSHLAPGPDLDVRLVLDLIDQVARHRRLERPPGDDVDLARVVGELDHGLAGRVRLRRRRRRPPPSIAAPRCGSPRSRGPGPRTDRRSRPAAGDSRRPGPGRRIAPRTRWPSASSISRSPSGPGSDT